MLLQSFGAGTNDQIVVAGLNAFIGPFFDQLRPQFDGIVHHHVHIHGELRHLLQALMHSAGDGLAHS